MANDSKPFTHDPAKPVAEPAVLVDGDVRELARIALQRLTQPNGLRVNRSCGLTDRLDDLCEAFLSDSNEDRHIVIHQMRLDGISANEIIDHVIPAVAAVLGQRWADDTLSFVEVTIGSARLQEAVRALIAHELSRDASNIHRDTLSAGPDRVHTPKVLLLVPRPEHHTLGAFVAADQFRRFGYDVDIAVDQHPKQVAATLRDRRYCMIGISIAGRRTLASTRELVDIIRATVTRVTPIVLGGSLLETDQDLKKATGVDYVARTVRDALELCGLNIVELDPPRELMADHV
ncbi:cobalamin B12-binding domain-containing protein [Jannaschia sp. CCS1]|uniref:cobalamin B12-binding domain-containing protein n=1 Tax=Jannaschia sp. (strain CCS1) TaxID=290400 RepID=UPI000053A408|nr:cobalamin B12-binding domain-containing protein [Jannaschia sp. CCS1]ABD53080.1 Regulatory protein ppaA [Jannaschia sp. CCS1]